MTEDEKRHFRTISNISKNAGVSLDEAQLFLTGRQSELSPETRKKFLAASLDPETQAIMQELRDIKAKVESLALVSPFMPSKKSTAAKRTKDKGSIALDAFVRKHSTKPNKELLGLVKKKFPDMDVTLNSIKMRKTRLRNKSEG